MSKTIVISIGIFIIVLLVFTFTSNITGNVITGSVVNEEVIENEYFKIDGGNTEINKENLNGTQNNSRPK
jgi:hypothetical protein